MIHVQGQTKHQNDGLDEVSHQDAFEVIGWSAQGTGATNRVLLKKRTNFTNPCIAHLLSHKVEMV